jgi:hypothetical protein
MIIYILVILVFLTGIKLYGNKNNPKLGIGFYIFECIILTCIAGFRSPLMGNDAQAYAVYFYDLPTFNELSWETFIVGLGGRQQPLWLLFNAFCKSIANEYIVYQLLHAIIVNVCIFIFAYNFPRYKFQFVLLFALFRFWYFEFEIQREILAISIFLLSYKFLFSKKYLIYFLFCFISFLFHSSAIFTFFIPAIVIIGEKLLSNKHRIVIVILVVALAIALPGNVSGIINFIAGQNELIAKQAELYTEIKSVTNGAIIGLLDAFVYLILLFLRERNRVKNSFLDSIILFFVISSIISFKVIGFYRFNNYLYLFYLIALVETIMAIPKTSSNKFIIFFVILFMAIERVYDYSQLWGDQHTPMINYYVPYISIF